MIQIPFNKTIIRYLVMGLLGLFILLGFARACFFSSTKQQPTQYLIARDINWSGFSLSGKELNLQAFAEELALSAAKEANFRIQFVPADPRNLLEGLQIGKYDAIFTFMLPNSINQNSYLFSKPLYLIGSVLVVRNELSNINNLSGMKGKLVGIKKDSVSVNDLSRYPSIILLTYDNIHSALNDVAYDKIDGVIMDAWSAHVYANGIYDGKIRVATAPFTKDGLRLATLNDKDYEDFMKRFNEGLERVTLSGKYQELLKKWDIYEMDAGE